MPTHVDATLLALVRHNGSNGGVVHEGYGGEQVVLHLQVEATSEEVAHNAAPVGAGQHLLHAPITLSQLLVQVVLRAWAHTEAKSQDAASVSTNSHACMSLHLACLSGY